MIPFQPHLLNKVKCRWIDWKAYSVLLYMDVFYLFQFSFSHWTRNKRNNLVMISHQILLHRMISDNTTRPHFTPNLISPPRSHHGQWQHTSPHHTKWHHSKRKNTTPHITTRNDTYHVTSHHKKWCNPKHHLLISNHATRNAMTPHITLQIQIGQLTLFNFRRSSVTSLEETCGIFFNRNCRPVLAAFLGTHSSASS